MEETREKVVKMLLEERGKFQKELEHIQTNFRFELLQEEKNATKTHTADYNMACSVNNGNRASVMRKVISKFDLAIERAKEGTYGICVDCGEQIPIGRLQQVPFTERCVSCKRATEEIPLHKQEQEPAAGLYFRPARPELRSIFMSPAMA